jgi:hypothetical protein
VEQWLKLLVDLAEETLEAIGTADRADVVVLA